MESQTAKSYYFREHPDHDDAQFWEMWRRNDNSFFEELVQKHGVIDIVGNRIEVGDTVAYSISVDRSALLFLYEVLEVRDNGKLKVKAIENKNRWRTPTRASALSYPESRCIVVKKHNSQ